jgi:non-specific serine/threonine protein kinase
VSLNDDMQMGTEPARGADSPTSAPSTGNADAGATRSHVHSVRPIGSIVGERFIVKAHLGRGRLDERYSAVDRSLSDPDVASERSVVLHFLNGRVAQQTRLLQKLETSYHHPHSWAHRNLIGILGFGSDRGEYFFVTEELEGGTLRTILDEVAPEVPPEEETFSVLAGIGDALKYAHA